VLLNVGACPSNAQNTENCKAGLALLSFRSSKYVTEFGEFHQSAVYDQSGAWVGDVREANYSRYDYTEAKATLHEEEVERLLEGMGIDTSGSNGLYQWAPVVLSTASSLSSLAALYIMTT